jgi:SAM-dependent methyltransferase
LKGKRWTFVQCEDCGQAFHRDVLSPEWNEIRFTRWMTHEAIRTCLRDETTPAGLFRKAVQSTHHVLRLQKLTISPRKGAPVRLLDFGCGYGEFLELCRQYGYEAVGIDRAKERRKHARVGGIFASLDELLVEVGRRKFHVITLFETLEHLDDPRSTLEELTRHLVSGGILILETPDCTGVTDITTTDESWRIQPLDHINAFTPATLRSIAERCGYSPIRRPEVHVSESPFRAAKTEVKRLLGMVGLLKPTTQQYFRKN